MVEADRRAAARTLRLAAFLSALVAALRFGLNTQSDLVGPALAVRLDGWLDVGSLATLAFLADCATRLAARSPPDATRRVLSVAALCVALGLGVELVLWILSRVDSPLGRLAEPALLAVLLWATGRALLWFGLFSALARERRAPPAPLAALVPLCAGLRVLLFIGTMLTPYLEAGGETRRIFLSTATLRGWLALGLAIAVDGALAWLAGRAARAA